MAWQTLTMVSPSVHVVRSTKTRLSLSHHAHSTLRDQAANTNFDHDAPAMQHPVNVRLAVRTALALQHLGHVRLAVRASINIDPPVNPTHCQNRDIDLPTSSNINYPQRTSRCTNLRLDRHQLPATFVQMHQSTTRPTSATRNIRPAAPIYDSINISYPKRSSCCILRLDRHQLPATIVYHTSY